MEVEFEGRPIRPGSLIWSDDNIFALVTPTIMHIFAPSLNGTPDSSLVKFTSTSAPALTSQDDSPPWKLMGNVASLRNAMVPSIEFIMAAWSPTGCTRFKGCMLACITSKHSVFVYIPSSSQVDKQWRKYTVLDKYMLKHWRAENEVDLGMMDNLESVTLAWSPKISMDNIGSVLAVGNKSGHIMIWHVTDQDNVRCVKAWKTSSNSYIIKIAWSPWMIEDSKYVSTLAYASADGSVFAQRLKFSRISPLENIEVSEDVLCSPLSSLYSCTCLLWSPTSPDSARKSSTLAFSKGNRVHLWKPDSGTILSWRKPIAKAVADMRWDMGVEKLFVFFMDGKHSVLRLEQDELKVDEEYTEFIHQEIISQCHLQERTNVIQDEETDNTKDDEEGDDEGGGGGLADSKLQLHIVSASRSAGGSFLATLYYVTSPFRMEFQRERFLSCTVMLSKTYRTIGTLDIGTLLERLQAFIRLPNSVIIRNPTYELWDILLLLNRSSETNEVEGDLEQGLWNILKSEEFHLRDNDQAVAAREALPKSDVLIESRLESAIFSGAAITAARICIYLWTQLQNSTIADSLKEQLKERTVGAIERIRRHNTYSILKYFHEILSTGSNLETQIQESDYTLLLLLCDSILVFYREDKGLLELAEKTYSALHDQSNGECDVREEMKILQEIKKEKCSTNQFLKFGRESCPACSSEVRLESQLHGICINGHRWQRCSVTLLLLADFHPRTCLRCRRKVLMVPENKSDMTPCFAGSMAKSWLELVLRANSVCCFCGERYFTALRRK
ncbi:transcription factor IIIC subunit delta N-term-domain-containing protein [Lobosporangium transversale]|uniref:Transcription factor IIIC subunit delta N-term-domain-containing protein n=1 Tax=Lobosporangium transversale TaxID=64571 RepID=A0A1Y2GBJ8_9FUNG|nr:transcription factor IIIC subunit delta N-term-domain-containing protein [Lobosporangium transversale]ORZ06146.1 transcription factor IIIC subunit delta N-term-domain-containing protein [Lobosporangium transversale]|eukprot:XP_021877415.1 transcription factor IIIC subunit delta N-term-domain-containing protein [Lobosporangium transversale]